MNCPSTSAEAPEKNRNMAPKPSAMIATSVAEA
jgi:hypothetical protein